jgi:hypothetical protein
MAIESTKVHHRLEDFRTSLARLSYARDLYKPRAQEEGKAPKYGCTLIFPKSAKPEFYALIKKLILATPTWGEPALKRFENKLIKNPLLDGDGKEAHSKKTGDLHAGMGPDVFFIRPNANQDRPPYVVWKNKNVQETETTVYSGCYVWADLTMYSYTHPKSGDGIGIGLNGILKREEGERLGGSGGPDAEKFFETIADDGPAPDSTKNGDGAGGLFGV